MHEFSLEDGEINTDGQTTQDGQVFSRHHHHVLELERAQHSVRRLARTGVADAGEVGGEVEGGRVGHGRFRED